jgi:ketosteroid isomerase-like protein
MRLIVTAAAAALVLAGCTFGKPEAPKEEQAASSRPSDAESEAYMRKAEEDWADLWAKKDPAVLERILADDYVGVSSDNVVRDKKVSIKEESEDEPDGRFVSAELDYVNYRHFGDTVLAQGAESVKRADGGPDLRLIWTDVWMWRDGKWQIVASCRLRRSSPYFGTPSSF